MCAARSLAALGAVVLAGCGGGGDGGPFGPSTIVVVVNPPENAGNTAELPAVIGTVRAGVAVDIEPGAGDVTDATGLAIIAEDLGPGEISIVLDGGPAVAGSIAEVGDVYDVAIGYDGTAAALYPGFPIRYGIGGEIVEIATDGDATIALNTDNVIVFFDNGVHVGNLVIEGENVILFGEGFPDASVVIDGSVEVRGGSVRLRGVTITGGLTVLGNNFGMSFSVVHGATQLNGQAISFLGNVFCGGVDVPSSDAALFDNEGVDPLPLPPPPICP
jgi:hypothetical protein